MKKCLLVLVAVAFAAGLALPAAAAPPEIKLSGPHIDLHFIGMPKNTHPGSGDDSNGRAIFIPLRNVRTDVDELICPEDADAQFIDDTEATFQTAEPYGAKLYWETGDHFEIVDRDATDADGARIIVPYFTEPDPLDPTNTQKVIAYDVFVRVHGKPNTCINISGWAVDEQGGVNYYFWAGTIALARKTGRATWTNVTDMFDVNWCDVTDCVATTKELSVFNDVFDDYFWNFLNDGTRNVELRLYPRTGR